MLPGGTVLPAIPKWPVLTGWNFTGECQLIIVKGMISKITQHLININEVTDSGQNYQLLLKTNH